MILVIALALIAAGLYAGYLGGMRFLAGVLEAPGEGEVFEVELTIPEGASTNLIAELLHAEGLIRHPLALRMYAKAEGVDAELKAGTYRLRSDMAVAEIVEQLRQGGAPIVLTFTVPEGLTVEETAALLSAQGFGAAAEFLELMQDPGPAADLLPPDAPVRQPLEGYLFPDTYHVAPDVTPREIIDLMVGQALRVWTEERRQRARELGLSVHEAMTLAAVVEKEARVAAERPLIAGVFHNRLQEGMRLDADPTVRYALQIPYSEPVLYVHLESEDPYNTYRHTGLPPGPIASPGEASILAVLYPEETEYFYFVAKEDGSGEHVFSRTLAEHEAATRAIRADSD